MTNELMKIFEDQIRLLASRSKEESTTNEDLAMLTRAMCDCVAIVNGESMLNELHRKMMSR